jgi:peptidyl-dipeptidase A
MNRLATTVYAQTAPTAAEAQEFMNKAETQLSGLSVKVQRASWVQENFITDDTQAMAADAIDEVTAATTELVEQAKRFDGVALSPDLART